MWRQLSNLMIMSGLENIQTNSKLDASIKLYSVKMEYNGFPQSYYNYEQKVITFFNDN
jgi:hypothetical protein